MKRSQLVALLIAVGALLIACGGGGSLLDVDDPADDPDTDDPPSDAGICTPQQAEDGWPCRLIVSGTIDEDAAEPAR